MNAEPPPPSEAQVAEHVARLLRTHERLLADGVRNRAFHTALSRAVRPGSVVLDIGAGTGVWAIAAALLGAKKVVAIEADEILTGMIQRLASECGVGDRVKAVWGLSTQIQLAREFDLVVSETIGYDGFEEQIVPIMADARNRFLRPGGAIIPETVGLFAAPSRYQRTPGTLPRGLPFTFNAFSRMSLHAPLRLRHPTRLRLLGRPKRLLEVDLMAPPTPSVLEHLQATWKVSDSRTINCFAVWVESRLGPGVRLTTRRTTSWSPVLYRFDPIDMREGRISFDLSLASTPSWTLTARGAGPAVSQQYSAASAARRMLLDLRLRSAALSPHGASLVERLADPGDPHHRCLAERGSPE